MRLTPEACAAVYDCLRQLSPFSGWKLPPADEVAFHVSRDRANHGWAYQHARGEFALEISEVCNGHFNTLASTIAHEMIHLYQFRAGLDSRAEHNADFKRRAARVCAELGWDAKAF